MQLYQPDLSHIYIEEGAEQYPLAQSVLDKYASAVRIPVKNYKSFFNRQGQDFVVQKKSMKLILAVKKPPFLYPATDVLQRAGFEHFFYTTPLLNCLYNCQYCFLQGMYPSANLVAFVNDEDIFAATHNAVQQRKNKRQPLVLSISYNTDLLAFENIIPYCSRWLDFCKTQPDLLLEIRSKSAFIKPIQNIEPQSNVLLSWTLSPQQVVDMYEWDTPPLAKRIAAVQKLINRGWKVRLCFDPLMIVDKWQDIYTDFFQHVFTRIPAQQIYDIVVGVFRMNKDFFQSARKREPQVDIYYKKYELNDGVLSIPLSLHTEVRKFAVNELSKYIARRKIELW